MDLLLPDTGLLFWMTVIFALVFFVLAKFGFPVITGMVDKRTKRIDEALSAAKAADEKIATLTLEQERLVARTADECARMMQEAAGQRDMMLDKARLQAKEEADRILAQAKETIAKEREAAMRDVRREVASLSLVIAESIVRKELSSDASQRELVDKLIDEVRNMPMES